MKKQKGIIVVTGIPWKEHLDGGYRTRQGAVLCTLASIKEIDSLIHVIEAGFRASPKLNYLDNPYGDSKIIEVYMPNRLPELFFRHFGTYAMSKNFILCTELKDILNETEILTIWTYSATAGILFRSLTGSRFLYDAIDYRVNDPNISSLARYIYRDEINNAIKEADILACNSEYAFHQHLKKRKHNCYLIRNGVDPSRFEPFRNSNRNGKVLFVGAISQWTDFELLHLCLENFFNIQFDFYGIIQSAADKLEELKKHTNFHWHGTIPASEVPGIMASYSVALVPYYAELTQNLAGDSMKIFEYLASGTPVVSTNFQTGLEKKFNSLIQIAQTQMDFILKVGNILRKPVDEQWKDAAWAFVRENTWNDRIHDALQLFQIK